MTNEELFNVIDNNIDLIKNKNFTWIDFAKKLKKSEQFKGVKLDSLRRKLQIVYQDYDTFKNNLKVQSIGHEIEVVNGDKVSRINAAEYIKALNNANKLALQLQEKDKLLDIYKNSALIEESILKILQDLIPSFKYAEQTKKIKIIKGKKYTEVANCILSDVHFGEDIRKLQVLGLNEYNSEIAKARLWKYLKTILILVDSYRKNYNIDHLNIFMLGDMLSGVIHEELKSSNELNAVESLLQMADILSQFIKILLDHFKTIDVNCVYGNHARIYQKKHFKNRYDNFEYILYNIIKIRLNAYHEANRVKFNINQSPFAITDILGHKFLYSHGDDIKSWNGISYYGIKRKFGNLKELFEQLGGFDYWLLGHFHDPNVINSGKVIMNGSIKGLDEYALANISLPSYPSQKFFGVNQEYGVSWMYDVQLKTAKQHQFN